MIFLCFNQLKSIFKNKRGYLTHCVFETAFYNSRDIVCTPDERQLQREWEHDVNEIAGITVRSCPISDSDRRFVADKLIKWFDAGRPAPPKRRGTASDDADEASDDNDNEEEEESDGHDEQHSIYCMF